MELLFGVLILISTIYILIGHCSLCKTRLTATDRMAGGRIRYRKRGTNLPVCRSCGVTRRSEVE